MTMTYETSDMENVTVDTDKKFKYLFRDLQKIEGVEVAIETLMSGEAISVSIRNNFLLHIGYADITLGIDISLKKYDGLESYWQIMDSIGFGNDETYYIIDKVYVESVVKLLIKTPTLFAEEIIKRLQP